MFKLIKSLIAVSVVLLATAARADIFQWEYINPGNPALGKQQSMTLCPGGAGVNAVPSANLSSRNLTMAYMIGANLTGADFETANLTNAELSQAILDDALFYQTTLAGVNFTDSQVIGALFAETDLTAPQLYSTASYQAHDLRGIWMISEDLSGWNFAGQNLSGLSLPSAFAHSDLTNADLSQANLAVVDFTATTLTGANLRQAYLGSAFFADTNLTNADLTGADIRAANFIRSMSAPATGITPAQLSSTASYLAHDLSGINFTRNVLTGIDLTGQILTGALFNNATLTDANLSGVNLTDVSFSAATLTNANLAGAEVRGANFAGGGGGSGLNLTQLTSTASYAAHDLTGVNLSGNPLTGADFTGQNLTNVNFSSATLTSANFSGRNLTSTFFSFATLASANLSQANLTGGSINSATLTSANLSQANLTNANFSSATLTDADLAGAEVRGANFTRSSGTTPVGGITAAQLSSTTSYAAHDLTGINLTLNLLTAADLSGQNLTNANFNSATLTSANLAGAVVRGANFTRSSGASPVGGITVAQLSSTASYAAHDLTGINLTLNILTAADLSGQNLTNANFNSATLTGANLAGAVVRGANFTRSSGGSPVGGITVAQLTSTASHAAKELSEINLTRNTLTSANLAGQNLTKAIFTSATLTGANLTAADVRGATGLTLTGTTTSNLIRTNGAIEGLNLSAGALLAVRDYDFSSLPITVNQQFAVSAGGTLRMVFDEDAWGSTISFAAGIPVTRGGTLELTFADNVNLSLQIGRTIDLFGWTGVTPTGAFSVSSPYTWNLAQLYTTGEVTLTSVPGVMPGDFNNDNKVDAGDYVVWRKSNGTPAAYNIWRANFGQAGGSGAGASGESLSSAVPEPGSILLLTFGALGALAMQRRRHCQSMVPRRPNHTHANFARPSSNAIRSRADRRKTVKRIILLCLVASPLAFAAAKARGQTNSYLPTAGEIQSMIDRTAEWSEDTQASTAAYSYVPGGKQLDITWSTGAPSVNEDFARIAISQLFPADNGDGDGGDLEAFDGVAWSILSDTPVWVKPFSQSWGNSNWQEGSQTSPGCYVGIICVPANTPTTVSINWNMVSGSFPASDRTNVNQIGFQIFGPDLAQNGTTAHSTLSITSLLPPPPFNIFQWEYVNPHDPSQGKRESVAFAPDGYGLHAEPGLQATGKNLTKAFLIGANLTNAVFSAANLTNADLSQANLTSANFDGANLARANFRLANLTAADLHDANLTGAKLNEAILTDANVKNTNLSSTHITVDQLYSTASYRAHDLTGIGLVGNDLSGINLVGQLLVSTNLYAAKLNGANLTNANLTGATLINADLTQANLTNTNFTYATVALANLGQAKLTNANLSGTNFTGTNLMGADVRGARLGAVIVYEWVCNRPSSGGCIGGEEYVPVGTFGGINLPQLTTTASYQAHDLSGVDLSNVKLAGANFAGFNLTNANFNGATLTGANLSAADARGAAGLTFADVVVTNLIRPDGHLDGLDVDAGQVLVVRDYDGNSSGTIPVRVDQHLAMGPGGTMRMEFEADSWDSTVSFASGIPVTLGGNLELAFAVGVNLASQIGRTFDVFDWTGVSPTGTFAVRGPYVWDLSNIYTTGEVRFLAASGLPGDFNGDNAVDAADYTVWRHGLDTIYTTATYGVWKSNFGAGLGSGSGAADPLSPTVPEPCGLFLFTVGFVAVFAARPRRLVRKLGIHHASVCTCLGIVAIVAFPPRPSLADGPHVQLKKIGAPIWKPVDFHLFSAPADSFPVEYLHVYDTLLPYDSPSVAVYNPHTPPYDTELSAGVLAGGYADRSFFTPEAITLHPNGVYFVFMLVPDPGITGSSRDFASGPVIPNSIFPLSSNIDVWLDGVLVDRALGSDADIPVQPHDAAFQGTSHFPEVQSIWHPWDDDLTVSPIGSYELRWSMRDVQGSGWDMFVPFRVTHPGDFDGNGTVDAADYVLWRKTGGSADEYNEWRANIGRTFFSGSASGSIGSAGPLSPAVPEPAAVSLLMFAALGWGLRRHRVA